MSASEAIREALEAQGDPKRAVGEKKYLKSELVHFGCALPVIRKVVRAHVEGLGDGEVVAAAEALWDFVVVSSPDVPPGKVGVHECRAAAVVALSRRAKKLTPEVVPLVERMIRQARTWALVDPLSTDVMGPIHARHDVGATLDRWAADADFWIRRASMLTLLRPLRAGEGDWVRFARYADAMLDEKEFFVRKAIGWILRDASKKTPDRVDAWIAPRTHRASGVTMREAVKYLPADRAEALMAAYRAKRPAASADA